MNGFDRLRKLWPGRGSYKGEVAESFVTNVILAGLQLLTGILLARLLGPQGRGELLAIQALPLIIGTFGMLGLQDALIYFGARSPQRIGEYAVSSTVLIILLGIPIVAVSAWWIPSYLHAQSDAVIHASQLYLGLLFVHALTSLSTTALRAAHDISLWNRLRIVPTLLWLVVILGLAALERVDPVRVALGYLLLLFVWCFIAIVPARRYYRESRALRPALWPALLRYGLPVAVGGTPRILNHRVDQLIIAGLFAAEELGYYGAAASWAALAEMPGTAMISVAFSKIARMDAPAARRVFAHKALWSLAGISLVVVLFLATAAPLGIRAIFGEEFSRAALPAMILTVGAALRSLVQMTQNLLMGVGKPAVVMYSEWGGFAVLAALVLALAPRFGLAGVAWAVLAGNLISLVLALLLFGRWSRHALDAPDVLP